MGVYAHKKKDTHTLAVYVLSRRGGVLAKARKNNDSSAFSSTFYYSTFERREGEREREREREKRFESSYFILFVVGVLKCVSFTETLPFFWT